MATSTQESRTVFWESNPPHRTYNLRSGWEQYRTVSDRSLDGTTLNLVTDSGETVDLEFADGNVSWKVSGEYASEGSGTFDLTELRPGILFIDIVDLVSEWSLVVVYDESKSRAVILINKLIARWGALSMVQVVMPALSRTAAPDTPYIETSSELTGKRALVRYEDDHVIEHYYANTTRLGWVLLSGKNGPGNGNLVRASYWKVAEDLFFFAFVETRPESVCLLMDFEQKVNVGKLFARDDLGLVNLPAGARIDQFGEIIEYPEDAQPV